MEQNMIKSGQNENGLKNLSLGFEKILENFANMKLSIQKKVKLVFSEENIRNIK